MASSVTVKPGILGWARETLGLTQDEAVEKLKVTPETLTRWEAGEAAVSLSQLKRISRLYKRPLGVFFLPAAPNVGAFPADFRTLDSTHTENLSPAVRLAVRRAQRNREIYKEIADLLEEKRSEGLGSYSYGSDPEKAAAEVRKKIGVSLEEQFSWETKAIALKKWVAALEKKDYLVSQMGMPMEELRAFCLKGDGLPPAIVLNTRDDEKGRIFSLWHELGHLLVPHAEIEAAKQARGEDKAHMLIEMFANRFAGAFLIPRESIIDNPAIAAYLQNKSDTSLTRLAGKYKISPEALLRRLLTLGLVEEDFYKQKRQEFEESYKKYLEEKAKKDKEDDKHGFQPPSARAFQAMGASLTGRVFEAQSRGKISPSDIAKYFEVKTQHFGKIKALLDKRASI